jgi:hypothetical protein
VGGVSRCRGSRTVRGTVTAYEAHKADINELSCPVCYRRSKNQCIHVKGVELATATSSYRHLVDSDDSVSHSHIASRDKSQT